MKKVLLYVLATVLLLGAGTFAETANVEDWAREALFEIASDDMEAVCDRFDETVRAQVSPEALRGAWAQITGAYGALAEVVSARSGEKDGLDVAVLLCLHDGGYVEATFAFDSQGKIAGLNFRPAAAPADAGSDGGVSEENGSSGAGSDGEASGENGSSGAGSDGEASEENGSSGAEPGEASEGIVVEDLALRPGEADETRARLTLPEGDGPFPAVILVQGSGPSDMDETIYQNKPFRDLAEGLAARGVASIRYDKYTYAHAENCLDARFTVEDEYIRDALAARALLAADGRIGKIFLVGHSQGAMLAPRILLEADGALSGAALLSGSPLPLWRIQYAQNLDVVAALDDAALDADARAETLAQIEAEASRAEAFPNLSAEAAAAEGTLFGLPAYYQWDEMRVDAAGTARALSLPLFVAQGGADFQVAPELGADAWREALLGTDFAEFHLYPGLNHLLMEAGATGTAADYAAPGRVSDELLDDLAAWIQRTAG